MSTVIDAIKAVAEMCGIFHKHLKVQGFSNKEALILTEVYLETTLAPKPKANNE